MAQQTISGYVRIPEFILDKSPSYGAMLIDAAAEKAAFIVQAPKTGTISKVGFRTMTVTTGDTVDVRLETVSAANGNPTGTLLGANSNGSQVIGAGDDNTWFTTSLTSGVAVTKGDIFAAVIANGGGGGNMQIARIDDTMNFPGFPYCDLYTIAWAKQTEYPAVAFEYDDGSYAGQPYVLPCSGLNQVIFGGGDDPDHRGLKFSLPFPCRLTGFWIIIDADNDPNVKLYDSDGTTVLETVSIDSNQRRSDALSLHQYYFASNYDLSKDVFYRLVVEPTAAGSTVDIFDFDVASAAVMDAFPGGQNFHYTEKKDAGWTDTTTKRPFMGLLVDGYDDGVGGGGVSGARNPLRGSIG